MENFGGPELQKYARINQRGRNRLTSGEAMAFTEFSETLQNRFLAALEFTPESFHDIEERVLAPLKEIEERVGIRFIMAGRDFPLHSTLIEGVYAGTDENERDEIFVRLQSELQPGLKVSQFQFDYVLLDGGNLLLTAKNIPEDILKTREELSGQYSKAGLKPLEIDHILHSTLARVNEFPIDFNHSDYEKEIISIRHSISSNPLIVTTSGNGIVKGQSYNYLTNGNLS